MNSNDYKYLTGKFISDFCNKESMQVRGGQTPSILKEFDHLKSSHGNPKSFAKMAGQRQEFIGVILMRYEAAHFFQLILERLIKECKLHLTSKVSLINELQDNLEEELGISVTDYGPPHVMGRRAFFRDLGLDYQAWERNLGTDWNNLGNFEPPARNLISYYKRLVETDVFAGAVAMLYWEGRIHRVDYPLLIAGVENMYHFPKSGTVDRHTEFANIPSRWHLDSHAEHDRFHEQDLIRGVVDSVETKSEYDTVRRVLPEAKDAWENFWNEIEAEVLSRRAGTSRPLSPAA